MVRAFSLRRRSSMAVSSEQCFQEKVRAVLQLLQRSGHLTPKQLKQCNEACIARFLKSRDGSVKRAAKYIRLFFAWRDSLEIEHLTADDFSLELAIGAAFIAGKDSEDRPVLVVRLKPDYLANQSRKEFLRYLVFTMEVAIGTMSSNVDQCIVILDAGCLRKGSPGISIAAQLLKTLGDYYPERVANFFVVDASAVLYYLWKGLGPFVDHGLKGRLHFVSSHSYNMLHLATSIATREVAPHLSHRHLCPTGVDVVSEEEYHESNGEGPAIATLPRDKQGVRSASFAFRSNNNAKCLASELGSKKFQSFRIYTNGISSGSSSSSSDSSSSSNNSSSSCCSSSNNNNNSSNTCSRKREKSWGDLSSLFLASAKEGPMPLQLDEEEKGEDQHSHHSQKKKSIDIFKPYLSFYQAPYNETNFRNMMKPPLGGLISIVSSELMKQPSVRSQGVHHVHNFHTRH